MSDILSRPQTWLMCIMPSSVQTNQNKLSNIFQLRHFRIFQFSNFCIMLLNMIGGETLLICISGQRPCIQINCYILKQFVNAKSDVYVKDNTQKSNLLLHFLFQFFNCINLWGFWLLFWKRTENNNLPVALLEILIGLPFSPNIKTHNTVIRECWTHNEFICEC